jgi:hypothetical protein
LAFTGVQLGALPLLALLLIGSGLVLLLAKRRTGHRPRH